MGRRAGIVVAAVALAAMLWRMSDPATAPPDDFVAFRSAARLLLAGANPYDPDALLREEQALSWTKDHPYRVWEPPWALALLAPFAALPYQAGRFAWFVVNLALLVFAADRLWLHYGGPPARRGMAWIVAITFAPAIVAWKTGQLGIWVLAGLAAFLDLERRGRSALAAAALVLLASVKPHVAWLVAPAYLLWTCATRRWRSLAAAAATVAGIVLATVLVDPRAVAGHVTAILHAPPTQATSTLGTVLRWLAVATTGRDAYWLAFLPPLAGLAWLGHRFAREPRWRWDTVMPELVLVSLVTAAFSWIFDAVVLLVPVVCLVAGWARRDGHAVAAGLLVSYVALDLAVLALDVGRVVPFWYCWFPPAMLVWYVAARRREPAA